VLYVTTKSALLGARKTHSIQRGSVQIEWSWDTQPTNTAIWPWPSGAPQVSWYTLRYRGPRNPNANVVLRLKQRVRVTGSVPPSAHVNAGRPRTVLTQPMRCHNRSCGRTAVEKLTRIGTIPAEGSRSTSRRSMAPIRLFAELTGFRTNDIYECSLPDGYDIDPARISCPHTTFCGQKKRFLGEGVLYVHSSHPLALDYPHATRKREYQDSSTSVFRLVSLGPLLRASVSYRTR
jgi:hypothetical protein